MNDYDDMAAAEAAQRPAPPQDDTYDTMAADEATNRDRVLKASINQATQVDPVKAGRIQGLADKTGLPFPVIERNEDYVAQRQHAHELQQAMQDSPILARQMTDPAFAKLAQDDAGNLGGIEGVLKRGALQLGMGATVGVGAQLFDMAGVVNDVASNLPGEVGGYFDQQARSARQSAVAARNAMEYFAPTNTGGNIEKGFLSGMQSAGQNLALLPVGLERAAAATVAQAGHWLAGVMSVGVGAQAYTKAREAGKGGGASAAYAVPHMAFEYAFEIMPATTLLKNIENKTGMLPFLWNMLKAEVPNELLTTLTQNLNDWVNFNPEKTLKQFLLEQPDAAAQTIVATIVGVGVQTGGVASVMQVSGKVGGARENAERAGTDAERLRRINDFATASKLRERAPDSFSEFVRQAAEHGQAPEHVYVDAEMLDRALHQSPVGDIPQSVREQLPEALAAKGDVQITIGDYATKLAHTEAGKALLEHLKTSPEAMSLAEARDVLKVPATDALHQEMQQIDQAASQVNPAEVSRQAVESAVLDKLSQANRFTSDVNRGYAGLISRFYDAMSRRLGTTSEDLYARQPLNITAENVATMQVLEHALTQSDNSLDFSGSLGPSAVQVYRGGRGARLTPAHFSPEVLGESSGHPSSGLGVFLTDSKQEAARYGATQAYHMLLKNPLTLRTEDLPAFDSVQEAHAWREELRQRGHDGLILDSTHLGGTRNFVAFSHDVLYQEEKGRLRGLFEPGSKTIGLFRNADLSTFLHESGHFFLDFMADSAALGHAPGELKADFDTLLQWGGIAGDTPEARLTAWRTMSLDEQRTLHEQFARGFEAYLFEGKAPSVEVQSLFQRFRSWLVNVYQSLRNLNVELTPEVRSVMDRMLATDEQIKQAEAARSYAPLFASAEQAGMTPEEFKAYQALGSDATREAVEHLERKSLRDLAWYARAKGREISRLQREAEAKRRAVAAEVTAEITAEPIYAAERWLKRGEMTDQEGNEVKAEAGFKLDVDAVNAMYPETMLARPDLAKLGTGKYGMVAKEGLAPDLVAELFGFSSGDELVRKLIDAEPFESAVVGITDQRMLERYGSIHDPVSLERTAEAAIHNDIRARVIATEVNALNKATGQRQILAKAARQFAEAAIARKRVRDVKPAQYALAETKAGRAAEAAFKKGDTAQAAAAKRAQMLNNQLQRVAARTVDEVQKGVEYLKTVGSSKSIEIGYSDQINQMLERFDLRSAQSLKAIDKRTALADWITSQEELGYEPTLSDQLRNEAFRKSFRDMTVEEVRGLIDAVKNIEHLGRLKKKLLTAADAREFDAVVADITAGIADNAKKTLPEVRSSERNLLVKTKSLFRYAAAIHRKFSSLVRELDGFKDGGKAWEYLVRNMNDRGNFEAVENDKATAALAGLFEGVKGVKLRHKTYFRDSGKSFSREEIIGIALNMGNEINRERVTAGEHLTPSQLGNILDTLTKPEWTFVQGVWDYLDTFRPQIAAKERALTGTEPEWVEASPVQTKFGEYKGGYYPIAYDPLLDNRSAADVNAQVQRQLERGLYVRAQTRRGHTKARAESTGRPLRYDFGDVLSRHVTQVIHDLAWHEYLIDANRLLRDDGISHGIRSHYGPEVFNEMRDALKDIAVGSMGAEKGAKFFNHLRYGTTIAGLGFNVFNTLQNLTGITQSFSRVGTGWVLKGAVHWFGDAVSMESSIAKIHAKSDFMRLRAKTMLREINDIRNKVSGNDSRLQASYFYLQTQTQKIVDVPTWWGAYEKAMATDDMTEAKAIALADQAVLDAQGGGQTKDLAGIQRGGSGLKLFTTFYSFFNTTFNLTAEAYGRTDFKKPRDVALFTADMALLYTIPALLSTLLKAGLSGDWDDEEKLKKKIIGDQLSYLLGTVVGLREATAGVQAATGTGAGFGYTGPASVRFFGDIYNLGKQIDQGQPDEAFWKSLNNVGGQVFRYPAGQINRTASGIAALSDGRTQNPGAVLMGAPQKR